MTDRNRALTDSITAYLANGGLFNPELADHGAVRDLLIECRDALKSAPAAPEPPAEAPKLDMAEVDELLDAYADAQSSFDKRVAARIAIKDYLRQFSGNAQ